MSKTSPEIAELFRDTLLSDEEIYWLGAPLYNFWHFKGRYFFYIFAFLLLFPLVVLAIYVFVVGVSFWYKLVSVLSSGVGLVLSYYLILFVVSYLIRHAKEIQNQNHLESESSEYRKAFYWWKPSYYAITNHRVLIFEQGSIRDYWYHLLDTPLLKKPKNRAASIQLYSSTYAAKKKKTPVLDTLRGIPENEADDAFAILKQAREEALEERKHKMGLG